MPTQRSLQIQLHSVLPVLGVVFAVASFAVSIVLFLHWRMQAPIEQLTRDLAVVAHTPIYNGFLSQIGMLFWAAATTVCLFGATLIPKPRDEGKLLWRFLCASGLLTLLLMLDDLFMLHEEIIPKHSPVPEEGVFASYGMITLLYLARFRDVILQTDYLLLGLAFLFFGGSVILDLLPPLGIDPFLLEDGAKFIGIVTWLAYFSRVVRKGISRHSERADRLVRAVASQG